MHFGGFVDPPKCVCCLVPISKGVGRTITSAGNATATILTASGIPSFIKHIGGLSNLVLYVLDILIIGYLVIQYKLQNNARRMPVQNRLIERVIDTPFSGEQSNERIGSITYAGRDSIIERAVETFPSNERTVERVTHSPHIRRVPPRPPPKDY